MMYILQLVIGIILVLMSIIFLSVGATSIAINYKELQEDINKWYTNPVVLIISGTMYLIVCVIFIIILIERVNSTKGCPEYQQINEVIYKKV